MIYIGFLCIWKLFKITILIFVPAQPSGNKNEQTTDIATDFMSKPLDNFVILPTLCVCLMSLVRLFGNNEAPGSLRIHYSLPLSIAVAENV